MLLDVTIFKYTAEAPGARLLEYLFGIRHLGDELLVDLFLSHAVLQLLLIESGADVVVLAHHEGIVNRLVAAALFLFTRASEARIQLIK